MWLVHETTTTSLKKILEDGYIQPSSETGVGRYAEDEKLKQVFMSVLFDKLPRPTKQGGIDSILLFFPLELMNKYTPSHWTSTWNYGDMIEDNSAISVEYNKHESPKENALKWKTLLETIHTKKHAKSMMNEVVFKKKIPISEAMFIYAKSDKKIDYEIPNRVTSLGELRKRMKMDS